MPTCRQLLSPEKRCVACRKRRSALACILRRVHLNQTEPDAAAASTDLGPRKRQAREFYADFATDSQVNNLDERLENDIAFVYPWCPPAHMGGSRRSPRLALQQMLEVQWKKTREKMKERPLHSIIQKRKRFGRAPAQPAQVAPAQPALPVQPAESSIDSLLSQSSKRRLIQIAFELLGAPTELNAEGDNQWDSANGVVNTIRDFLGLQSHRARAQIDEVLRYIMRCKDTGETSGNIDAGRKLGACNSGRRPKLTELDDRNVARCLHEGLGCQLTWAIINNGKAPADKVHISSVKRSAKRAFSGECHNRRTKKTGNKDPTSIWCVCRHEFSLQLQQQFREGDVPGESMIGKTVCKWFDDEETGEEKLFVGKIVSYDASKKWYRVVYSDGDVEELTFNKLRIREWKTIPRDSVLWLDEKVCYTLYAVTVTVTHTHCIHQA